MRLLATAFLVVMCSTTGAPQQKSTEIEHAPTVEQCRADASVWQVENLSRPSQRELIARYGEMDKCISVDTDRAGRYANVAFVIMGEMYSRTWNYIGRHNLRQQFYAEDDAGKR